MARDMARLQEIVNKMVKRMDTEHPGMGLVIQAFDSRGERDRPVAVYLHGINEEEAVRLMRQNADVIERAAKGGDTDSPIIMAPRLIKPVPG